MGGDLPLWDTCLIIIIFCFTMLISFDLIFRSDGSPHEKKDYLCSLKQTLNYEDSLFGAVGTHC